MSGQRRTQRSVRITVAGALLLLAGAAVIAAVVTVTWVSAAAIAAVLAGVISSRMIYSEVVQTRRDTAKERSAQAKSFGVALAQKQSEHTAYTTVMTARVQGKDRSIRELNGTIRLAERRADDAEGRVKRESKRANEAQTRLSELLDDVLVQQAPFDVRDLSEMGDDLPTIVNLLAWEDRVNEAMVDELRREA